MVSEGRPIPEETKQRFKYLYEMRTEVARRCLDEMLDFINGPLTEDQKEMARTLAASAVLHLRKCIVSVEDFVENNMK